MPILKNPGYRYILDYNTVGYRYFVGTASTPVRDISVSSVLFDAGTRHFGKYGIVTILVPVTSVSWDYFNTGPRNVRVVSKPVPDNAVYLLLFRYQSTLPTTSLYKWASPAASVMLKLLAAS